MEAAAIPRLSPSTHHRPSSVAPLESWDAFLADFRWRQGEHISLIGPTGQGKTTLGIQLLSRRDYVLALGTKPRDETLETLLDRGYVRSRVDIAPHELAPRQLFWPKTETVEDVRNHRAIFRAVLSRVYSDGGWTLMPDELRYFTDSRYLSLGAIMDLIYLQGRSNGISVVGGFQSPVWLPASAYDQPSHLFLWRNSDERRLRRLRELAGEADLGSIRRNILALDADNHEVLYVNTRTGAQRRTKAEV